ncbi:MFS transporter [Kribbella italica]|uniref:EmrB/QacA subfamily drug resistance transporter n=1 Tax=Kribbella italica TaxID=1540520 RepID=A0A7W9MYM8_9ACTN|nr:MFS transporter [Kribbella italica]MBB5840570.1 EmrB/QacA subfamily drug resistance transporter [Kribbella italica]
MDPDEPRRSRWILALVCAAQFVVVLDLSVVNVALPTIATDLQFRAGDVSWVANGYALTFGGLLLLGGRLADLYGHRTVFIAGLAVFMTASLLGGLATTPALLVGARAVQGIGAAILAPATLTILTTTFTEGPPRTRALVVYGAVGSIGGAAGNVLGGLITETISWRWILLINVPIGAGALLLATKVLPAGIRGPSVRPRLDVPGACLATIGVAALTWGVTQAEATSWNHPSSYLSLIIGAVAVAAFVLVETRFAAAPLIPFRLFRTRTVALGNFIVLLAGACFQIPMWYFLSFYFQEVLNYNALQTGLAFLPHTLLGIGLGLRLTPILMRRFEPRTLVAIGALIDSAAFVWQSRITADSTYLSGVLGPAVVLSIGGAFFFTPITSVVMARVPRHDTGAVSGIMNTAKQVGGALGLALILLLVHHQGAAISNYGRAFLAIAGLLAAIAALAALLPSTRDTDSATPSTSRP